MTAKIVRFPTSRVVWDRLVPCGSTPEKQQIVFYLRSVEGAISALQRQRQSLLMRFRAAARTKMGCDDGDFLSPTRYLEVIKQAIEDAAASMEDAEDE